MNGPDFSFTLGDLFLSVILMLLWFRLGAIMKLIKEQNELLTEDEDKDVPR